jgi:hypothetical protein
MSAQIEMFTATAPSTSLIGLMVILPRQCRACGGVIAIIGSSKGPHQAALHCVCGNHVGWMGKESFNFVCTIIDHFGRPEAAITVRESVNRFSTRSI